MYFLHIFNHKKYTLFKYNNRLYYTTLIIVLIHKDVQERERERGRDGIKQTLVFTPKNIYLLTRSDSNQFLNINYIFINRINVEKMSFTKQRLSLSALSQL